MIELFAATWVQLCVASTYNSREKWGATTASGVPLDDRRLTAAHRTHPLLGWLWVTSVQTQRTVAVQVTDRGPFGRGDRCIDLTEEAARKIGTGDLGPVEVRPVW